MSFTFDDRPSNSPFVARIWRCHSNEGVPFMSVAANHCVIVITKLDGKTTIEFRGPESIATSAQCPPDGEWLGIQLRQGVHIPHVPIADIVNGELIFENAGTNSFWFNNSVWEFPDYTNVEGFIDALAGQDLLIRDSLVEDLISEVPHDLSLRTKQRSFLQATGLPRKRFEIIERARVAASLLEEGTDVHDVIATMDYVDQPHLIRSLKRFIGQTPSQITDRAVKLSYLYNT